MKPRTMVELRCSTSANANNVRTVVANFLAGKNIFAQDRAPLAIQDDTGWLVMADVRFNARGDADTLRSQIQTNWATNARVLTGSKVTTHDCRHDEGQGFCTVDTQAVK